MTWQPEAKGDVPLSRVVDFVPALLPFEISARTRRPAFKHARPPANRTAPDRPVASTRPRIRRNPPVLPPGRAPANEPQGPRQPRSRRTGKEPGRLYPGPAPPVPPHPAPPAPGGPAAPGPASTSAAAARAPAKPAVASSGHRMSPSKRRLSAQTRRPFRRMRQTSWSRPRPKTSPRAIRPKTHISPASRHAVPSRSNSRRRHRRAPSKRMVSWGTHASRARGPTVTRVSRSAAGPRDRYAFSAAWEVTTAVVSAPTATRTLRWSPPAIPPALLANTTSAAAPGSTRGKKTFNGACCR